jgi:hypothetical protein
MGLGRGLFAPTTALAPQPLKILGNSFLRKLYFYFFRKNLDGRLFAENILNNLERFRAWLLGRWKDLVRVGGYVDLFSKKALR